MAVPYFLSNTEYNNITFTIDYENSGGTAQSIVNITTAGTVLEILASVNAVMVPLDVQMMDDEGFFYFKSLDPLYDMVSVVLSGDADGIIAMGTSYSLVDGECVADLFGAKLPFNFTLTNPSAFANDPDSPGGARNKEPFDASMSGETYNGLEASSSSKFFMRTGWSFTMRLNEEYKNAFLWFVESARNSYVTIKNASDWYLLDTILYDVQPTESETRTQIYEHLGVYESKLALLGR